MAKKFAPATLKFNFSKSNSTNGIITSGFDIGINFPKGVFIHLFSKQIYISKDGIATMLTEGYNNSCGSGFCKSFPIRLLVLLEIILFLISLPFQLIAYILIIVV